MVQECHAAESRGRHTRQMPQTVGRTHRPLSMDCRALRLQRPSSAACCGCFAGHSTSPTTAHWLQPRQPKLERSSAVQGCACAQSAARLRTLPLPRHLPLPLAACGGMGCAATQDAIAAKRTAASRRMHRASMEAEAEASTERRRDSHRCRNAEEKSDWRPAVRWDWRGRWHVESVREHSLHRSSVPATAAGASPAAAPRARDGCCSWTSALPPRLLASLSTSVT